MKRRKGAFIFKETQKIWCIEKDSKGPKLINHESPKVALIFSGKEESYTLIRTRARVLVNRNEVRARVCVCAFMRFLGTILSHACSESRGGSSIFQFKASTLLLI